MDPTLAGVLVAAVSAAGLLGGSVYTARSVARSSARTATNETARIDLERAKELRADIAELRRQRDDDNARHHAELESLRTDHEAQLAGLRDRVQHLEAERARDRARLHELVEWARAVLRLLRAAGIAHPPPPDGLDP